MPKFELREVDGPSNLGLFALEDIPKNNVICRESPFYSFSRENMMHYMVNKNPTSDPVLDAEIRDLQIQIQDANETYLRQKLSFGDEYPPKVRILLDRMVAIIAEKSFESESQEVQEKWMSLNDAHKQVRKDSTVGISGLTSENGKQFNGKIAQCRGFDKQKDRYIVDTLDEYNDIYGKQLKAENPNECITVAQGDIKAGDQLTLSYLFVGAGKDVKTRREELREKYGFECLCPACINEENS